MATYGFETGDFSNWSTVGNTSVQTTTPLSAPTQGNYQALITNSSPSVNDSTIEQFLGINAGSLDDLNSVNATAGSAIKLDPITVEAGDFITFDWNFQSYDGGFFNDFSFVSISSGGSPVVLEELADANNDSGVYQNFGYEFTTDGTYEIGMGVVDAWDTIVDSQLLIDNLRVLNGIAGDDGNDQLSGTGNDERIQGLDGDDTLYGNGGRDILIGGRGDDLIYGGSCPDHILGGEGDDIIYANGANNGSDYIDSGAGNDTIWLGHGDADVVLSAGDGFDMIKNFQLGQTSLIVSDVSALSFADGANGAEIYQGNDLLATVSWQSASTFANNVNDIFVAA
jgi:Ca2+-binding RTX toxin-like protein